MSQTDSTLMPFVPLQEADVTVDPNTGDVELTIIRPGSGNKRDGHYYSSQMLEANAEKYNGARMYKNHETLTERRQRQGMPRPVDDLGGVLRETWWDATWPDATGKPVGAVRGRATLFDPKMVTIARVAPHLLGVSHDARATSVKPSTVGGNRLLMVEGIGEVNSVDLVTRAGAGGQVDRVLESEWEENPMTMLASLTLDDLREHRPDLLESHAEELRESGQAGTEDFNLRVQEAADSRVADAVTETEERLNADHARELQVRDNLQVVEAMLAESKLTDKSKADLRRRFEAPFYEPTDEATPEAQLREALQTEIKEKIEELVEATGAGNVHGLGGKLTESEGSERPKAVFHDKVAGYITHTPSKEQ